MVIKSPHGRRVASCDLKDMVVPEPDDNISFGEGLLVPGTIY